MSVDPSKTADTSEFITRKKRRKKRKRGSAFKPKKTETSSDRSSTMITSGSTKCSTTDVTSESKCDDSTIEFNLALKRLQSKKISRLDRESDVSIHLECDSDCFQIVHSIRVSFERNGGKSIPHISLFFPFLPSEMCYDTSIVFQNILNDVCPFSLDFSHLERAIGTGKQVVYLIPNTKCSEMIKSIHQKLFDGCIIGHFESIFNKDIRNLPKNFRPHLTVGQTDEIGFEQLKTMFDTKILEMILDKKSQMNREQLEEYVNDPITYINGTMVKTLFINCQKKSGYLQRIPLHLRGTVHTSL